MHQELLPVTWLIGRLRGWGWGVRMGTQESVTLEDKETSFAVVIEKKFSCSNPTAQSLGQSRSLLGPWNPCPEG